MCVQTVCEAAYKLPRRDCTDALKELGPGGWQLYEEARRPFPWASGWIFTWMLQKQGFCVSIQHVVN